MASAELLHLDSQRLQVMGEAYEGYANVRTAEFPEMAPWMRANRLTIAASFWTPINPAKGAQLFVSAARIYSELGLNSWEKAFDQKPEPDITDIGQEVPLAICGQDTELLRKRCLRWLDNRDEADPPELTANKLLAFSHLAVTLQNRNFFAGLSHAREAAARLPAHRVGRLGLPLGFYSALADAVERNDREWRSLYEFATWLNAEVLTAQANEYLWRNLLSAILPINPLGLAFCCVWDRVIRQGSQQVARGESLFLHMPSNARAYFEAAHDIVRSGIVRSGDLEL
jgi:hypothetical protein